jgi:hypothetical protein
MDSTRACLHYLKARQLPVDRLFDQLGKALVLTQRLLLSMTRSRTLGRWRRRGLTTPSTWPSGSLRVTVSFRAGRLDRGPRERRAEGEGDYSDHDPLRGEDDGGHVRLRGVDSEDGADSASNVNQFLKLNLRRWRRRDAIPP